MKYIYAERNFNFTEDIKAYVQKKLAKLDKYFRSDAEASITARTERGHCCLEITVRSVGVLLRAACRDTDVFRAIDDAEETIERQIRKNKTRLEKRFRDGGFEWAPALSDADYAEEEEQEFDVVRTKRFSVKPMTVEEAILQMNLLNHEFFVFKNADDDERFSVVYKRHDGGYGLIENA
ncbi:MAG: ribosome-associated translation inhibitor RaiA [Oscillospiraceae bacterium]|nr:ribosome-associated translation inhibitor RaiA [Oscillospiraceae bacterium]